MQITLRIPNALHIASSPQRIRIEVTLVNGTLGELFASARRDLSGNPCRIYDLGLTGYLNYFTSCDPHHDIYRFVTGKSSGILSDISSGIRYSIWHIFWHSTWHIFWHIF